MSSLFNLGKSCWNCSNFVCLQRVVVAMWSVCLESFAQIF